MAIRLLRRESPSDGLGRPPPSCMRTLPAHAVHKRLRRVCSHHPHWPRIRILRRNRDRWRVIICVPIPNAAIHCSPQPMEEISTGNGLRYRSRQTGAVVDPLNLEPESRAAPLLPISTGNHPARGRAGRRI